MSSLKRLWIAAFFVIAASFTALGLFGAEIYREAPPIPDRVVTSDGRTLFTRDQILDGQNVWQSMGGQNLGSIWGHGGYVAPDWSADWLHRELVVMLDERAQREHGKKYDALTPEQQAAARESLRREVRENTYDPATGTLTVTPERAAAIAAVADHYRRLFGNDSSLDHLRDAYAIPADALKDPRRAELLTAFFFWTSWACATNRPGEENLTYSNNWPPEPLIGNEPTGENVVWSVVSFVLLLAGIGALVWYLEATRGESAGPRQTPEADPLLHLQPSPSMRATIKFFWAAQAVWIVQILCGAVTAHYGVEGSGFYGFDLAAYLPYAVTRTWHIQLGIFWIATAWLATGLFLSGAVAGQELRWQRAGTNFLFVCLLVIVVGSLFGEWLGVQQHLDDDTNFWFGHQGYEYVELGRFWQIFLLVGLVLWAGLMGRAIYPALRRPGAERAILGLLFLAMVAIALFYAAGLMYDSRSNLAIAEYWRWWVVHLWVEGFFEVFAAAAIAFLFTRLGLLRPAHAAGAVLFSTVIFLAGGILGTFHHLYFTGTPTSVLAVGATFSALEVVPLVLIGFEAYHNYRLTRARPWVSAYRWPIYFLVAVAFWNLVGAGLFGFLINPPIALYYMQGLNTTPVHGHTALFGVYGMLAIGLMLFCLRATSARKVWRTGPLKWAFWSINGGLSLMVLLSVLPVGLLQTWASVEHGLWYARSAEFLQTPLMDTLRWLRVIGDTIFAVGALLLAWFVLGLKTGWSVSAETDTRDVRVMRPYGSREEEPV